MLNAKKKADWPGGSGEVAGLIREHDWNTTPLGPVESWPQSLKTIVDLMLGSQVIMVAPWGSQGILLFNDAYRRLIGPRGAGALGRPVFEVLPELRPILEPQLAEVVAGRSVQASDQYYPFVRTQTLEDAWFDVFHNPILGEDGEVAGILTILNETTPRVEAERQRDRHEATLHESEERDAFLLKLSDALRLLADPIDVQDAAARMLGEALQVDRCYYAEIDREHQAVVVNREYLGSASCSLVGTHPLELFETVAKLGADNEPVVCEDIATHPVLGSEANAYRERGEQAFIVTPLVKGGATAVLMCLTMERPRQWTKYEVQLLSDVAERTWAAVERARAEAALRKGEEDYRVLLASIDEGFCVIEVLFDADEKPIDYLFLEVNPAFERQTGLIDAVGRTVLEMVPDHEKYWFEIYGRIAMTGEPARFENRAAAIGHWYDVYAFRVGYPEERRVAVLFNDILVRKQAEFAVRESEERLRALVDATSDVVYRMSPDWREMRHLVGRDFIADTDDPSHTWLEKYIHTNDQPEVTEAIDAAIEGKGIFDLEHRIIRVDGSLGWTHSRAVPLRDEGGEIVEWIGMASDISERKQAEAALRDSEELFRRFGEASSDVLWMRDAETLQWTYLTPAFETTYGVSREWALQGDNLASWSELILPEDREHALAQIERVRQGGNVAFEYRIRRPADGEIRWIRNTDFPLLDAAGKVRAIGGIGHDITERKEAADRMEVMVGELQHRTRNLIGVVRSIARQTMEASGTLDGFRTEFDGRMRALSDAQGLLSRSEVEPITVGALVDVELRALGADEDSRVTAEGPVVRLRNWVVQTLALVIHELATNARKYGALAAPSGKLSIRWKVSSGARGRLLRIEWLEDGIVHQPDQQTGSGLWPPVDRECAALFPECPDEL